MIIYLINWFGNLEFNVSRIQITDLNNLKSRQKKNLVWIHENVYVKFYEYNENNSILKFYIYMILSIFTTLIIKKKYY